MKANVELVGGDHPNVCGAIGCSDPLAAVVEHPKRGEIYVCEEHAEQYPTVREVQQVQDL